MPKIIEERPCATAEELVQALSPFDAFWGSTGGMDRWLFRGQRDASWSLVPSAARPDAFIHYGIGTSGPIPVDSLQDQLRAEEQVVFRFATACLSANLAIPEDGQWIRAPGVPRDVFGEHYLKRLYQGVGWPFSLHRSLYALAQHHGVATRLLDWSRSPFVASYFACADVAKALATTKEPPAGTKSDKLAIYALRRLVFEYVRAEPFHGFPPPDGYDRNVLEVDAPYAENPNLRAQQGTFTLVDFTSPRDPNDWAIPPLDAVLTDWCGRKFGSAAFEWGSFPFLVKFTIPLGQSRRLLRLLRQAQVWAPTVFPQYDAARLGIVEQAYWL